MARYKTLASIYREGIWDGQSLGQAKLLNLVNKTADNDKPLLSEDTLSTLLGYLTPSQIKEYRCYERFSESLSIVHGWALALTQQFYLGVEYLVKTILDLQAKEDAYKDFLSLPLLLSRKDFKALTHVSERDYFSQTMTAYEALNMYAERIVESYENDTRHTPVSYRAILSNYKDEYLGFDLDIDTFNSLKGQGAYLQGLLDNFARIYKTENTVKSVMDYILSTEEGSTLFMLGLDKTKKKKVFPSDKAVDILERFDKLQRTKSELQGTEFEPLCDQASLEKVIEKKKVRLNKVQAFSTYGPETLKKVLPDFNHHYTIFYAALKKDLSQKLNIFMDSDANLENTTLSYRDLIDAEVLSFRKDEYTDYILQRDFILRTIKPDTPEHFMFREQAKAGISIALTPISKRCEEFYERYGKAYDFFSSSLTVSREGVFNLWLEKCCYSVSFILSFNRFLEVFSDIFKVSLKPLQYDCKFNRVADTYNAALYNLYGSLTGDEVTLKKKKELLRAYFPPLIIDELEPKKEFVEAKKKELEALAKKNLLAVGDEQMIMELFTETWRDFENEHK